MIAWLSSSADILNLRVSWRPQKIIMKIGAHNKWIRKFEYMDVCYDLVVQIDTSWVSIRWMSGWEAFRSCKAERAARESDMIKVWETGEGL